MTEPIDLYQDLMLEAYSKLSSHIGELVLLKEATESGSRELILTYSVYGFPVWTVNVVNPSGEGWRSIFQGEPNRLKAIAAYGQAFSPVEPVKERTVERYLAELERGYFVEKMNSSVHSEVLGPPPSRLEWFADEWLDVLANYSDARELVSLAFMEVLDRAADGTLPEYIAASSENKLKATLVMNLPETGAWFEWATMEVPNPTGEGTVTHLTHVCGLNPMNLTIGLWDNEPTDCTLLHKALKQFFGQEV